MAITLKPHERLVCVGQTALRAPNGAPLPAVPLYKIVEAGDAKEYDRKAVMTTGESGLYDDIAAVFGEKYKQYVDGLKQIGAKL
ncbi:MAG: hypothetical protein FWE91_09700 [Defluviitaleaceae bacterium]|nr:hypothetical protein [Defluviitaleaceae bacterium]